MASPPAFPDTLLEARGALRGRRAGAAELVRHALDRIERLDGGLGAFVSTFPERALARARSSSARPTWTSSRWAARPRTARSARRATPGTRPACPAAAAAAAPRPW